MTQTLSPTTIKAILRRGAELKEEWPGTSVLMGELMEFWKTERPKMTEMLQRVGALEAFARCQEDDVDKRALELRKAMDLPAEEAESEARKEVLLMTPETWEQEDANLEQEDRSEVEEAQSRQIHSERLAGDNLL